MAKTFFPDMGFAWVFCIALIGLTGIAAWVDTHKAKVPNRLTVLIFALGLVINAVRGGWLAADNHPVWLLLQTEGGAWWLGAIDGLLFALTGFLVIFAIMVGLWIFNLSGGGDVKLLAAVATWLGLLFFLMVWMVTLVVLVLWTIGQLLVGGSMSPRQVKKRLEAMGKQKERGAGQPPAGKRGKLKTTFSFPLAIATAIVLMWLFRFDLQLVKPPPEQPQGTSAHVRPTPTHS